MKVRKCLNAAPWLVAAGVFGALLRYADHEPSGLLPYYESFRAVLCAGLDPRAATATTPTFPMWGYGILLVFVQSPAVLIGLQFGLTFGASFFLFDSLERGGWLRPREAGLARWMTVACLPWYAPVLTPYSAPAVGGALLLLVIALLARALSAGDTTARIRWLVAAGISFGLMLNFRSDYIYAFPVFIFVICRQMPRWPLAVTAWLLPAAILLVPWGLYTRQVSGRVLFTSTNTGHVLFIGLGNLPGNLWGITATDGDPVMQQELRREFGDDRSSLLPESDAYLKASWKRKIMADPSEYAKKCAYVVAQIGLEGFYPGVYDASLKQRLRIRFGSLAPAEIIWQGWREIPGMLRLRSVLMVISELEGRAYLWLGLLAFGFGWFRSRIGQSPLLLLLAALSAYQVALNVLGGHQRIYLNNGLLIWLIFGAVFVDGLFMRWRSSPPT